MKENYRRIVFVVKTNIFYDGRVLAELFTLAKKYSEFKIILLLLPDGDEKVNFPSNVEVIEIKLKSKYLPKSKIFQLIKFLEFGLIVYRILKKINPDVVHIQDEAAILGPWFYKIFNSTKKVIYDDHELKNLNNSFYSLLMRKLEFNMIKKADAVIMANNERKDYLFTHYPNLNKCIEKTTVIENYYFGKEINSDIKKYKHKIILHQGKLSKERGIEKIVSIIAALPDEWKMHFIGINNEEFEDFTNSHNIDKNKVINDGYISYLKIYEYWKSVDAAIIMYNINDINNKLCAPNRLYLAANLGIPIIVNNNPVLAKHVNRNNSGVVLNNKIDVYSFFNNYNEIKRNANLGKGKYVFEIQGKKLISLYNSLIN